MQGSMRKGSLELNHTPSPSGEGSPPSLSSLGRLALDGLGAAQPEALRFRNVVSADRSTKAGGKMCAVLAHEKVRYFDD